MTSAQIKLRQARAAAAKKKQIASSSAVPSEDRRSVRQEPSLEVLGEKRTREDEDDEDTTSRRRQRGDQAEVATSTGLHRLYGNEPAGDLVLPPAFGHPQMISGQTQIKLSAAEHTILNDMGPEALRAEIASSSVAVFKLLAVANFLNGRECQYLGERDEARKQVLDLELKLEKAGDALTDNNALLKERSEKLEKIENQLAAITEERDSLLAKVKELEGQKEVLEGKLSEVEKRVAAPVLDEEEKIVDPEGEHIAESRADLIRHIQSAQDSIVEVSKAQFANAVAQLQVLNPGVELRTEGLDEDKEVREGRIVEPLL